MSELAGLVIVQESERAVILPAPAPSLVVAEQLQPVMVRDASPPAVVQAEPVRVPLAIPAPAQTQMVMTGFSGPRGVQGPKGDPGGSGTLARPVGAIVQGLRIVRALDGVIYPVDLADESHAGQVIGLALQSVTVLGTDVNIQLAGPVTDSSWAWSPGAVWCGANGALTQAPPATGWLLQVGRVIAADTLDLDLSFPIYRG